MRKQVKGDAVAEEILPGVSRALLQELHLLTRDGDLNADSRRKLKQVNHFLGLLRPAIEDALARFGDPVIVDCGAGKGYLGFLLHDVFLKPAGKGTVWCVESRADLVRAAEERAARLGMTRMKFVAASIEGAPVPERAHVVTALHACDTATDDAILLALAHNADHVALVPCCQAEVARQLESAKNASPAVAPLFEHPWHRREFGSHLTNVLRVLALESKGYRVTVTELAGWEHSLKNELILGKRVRASDAAAKDRLDALLASTGVRPKVVRGLA
ncbi:MAG TPA: SAM-dependent methyltransferase [bacterium]|nr:SAM-dependent methyltransferase [bacterium]